MILEILSYLGFAGLFQIIRGSIGLLVDKKIDPAGMILSGIAVCAISGALFLILR